MQNITRCPGLSWKFFMMLAGMLFAEEKMEKVSDTFKLSNGYEIPCVGFGTWLIDDETAENAVINAINAGYRHIDTAAIYKNEIGVGNAIKKCGIKREELFITSKVWTTMRGYDNTLAAFEESMEKLGLSYLDLYLIHWPASKNRFKDWEKINFETWQALIKLYKEGRVRAIGVSNFLPHHLDVLMDAEIQPMVNQIEFHPGKMQEDALEFCRANNIQVEAWSPLGRGAMLDNATLAAIGDKYGKSIAQICIKWCLQNGVLPLPKSVNLERIKENSSVFDFEISEEDMKIINKMPFCGGSPLHPDTIEF